MTANVPYNASPDVIRRGVNDISRRTLQRSPEVVPQHLPLFYAFTQDGPETIELVDGESRDILYGADSFDLRKRWATCGTLFLNQAISRANSILLKRLKPTDAPLPAAFRLTMDVLPLQKPLYERNADGSFKRDPDTNALIPTGETVAGYRTKLLVTPIALGEDGEDMFGLGTQSAGDQTDAETETQSIRYPLGDWAVPSFGSNGNNKGMRVWAPTQLSSDPIDERRLTEGKFYPFRVAFVSRPDDLTTPSIVTNNSGEQYQEVSFMPGAWDRNFELDMDIASTLIEAYQDIGTPGLPPKYGPFGRQHIYAENVKTLVDMFYAAEKAAGFAPFSDFDGSEDEQWRFNFISGVSSANVPYNSWELVTEGDSVRLTETNTLWATGGGDGTMSREIYAQLVAQEVAKFADPDSPLQDVAKYPVSAIWDCAFPLETKYAMISALALRKDIMVWLCTHTDGAKPLSASEESSLAVALKARCQNYPESTYFGTRTMRAVIFGRSGTLINSVWKAETPVLLEVMSKVCDLAGAGDGKWRPRAMFDHGELARITMFKNINVTFTPSRVRVKDWDNGLNWVQSFDRQTHYIPALKTVYDDDTSILTGAITVMAITEVQKVGERAHRFHSGVQTLTDGQLVDSVNDYVNDGLRDRFGTYYQITPNAQVTEQDANNGFSWHLPIDFYGPNMKTVQFLEINARRLADLQQQAQ